MYMKACGELLMALKSCSRTKKKFYDPYIDIIDRRWDNMLKKNLHAAPFWLNPTFQYDRDNPCYMPEIMKSVLEVMQKLKMDGLQYMMDEISMFRSKNQSFGFQFAQNTYKTARPGMPTFNFTFITLIDKNYFCCFSLKKSTNCVLLI